MGNDRAPHVCAVVVGAWLGLGAMPAAASSAYVPPAPIEQGTSSHRIAGKGTVVVRVLIQPDGSHKAIEVRKSTNAGDNAAAMEIAQTSTYRPARRGATAIEAFYDYTLTFAGGSAASHAAAATVTVAQALARDVQELVRVGLQNSDNDFVALRGPKAPAPTPGIYDVAIGEKDVASSKFSVNRLMGKEFDSCDIFEYGAPPDLWNLMCTTLQFHSSKKEVLSNVRRAVEHALPGGFVLKLHPDDVDDYQWDRASDHVNVSVGCDDNVPGYTTCVVTVARDYSRK